MKRISLGKLVLVIAVLGTLCSTGWALPTVDLTFSGAFGDVTGSIGGTATFVQWVITPSTGSGKYDPFVRIQAKGSERGYNTNGQEEFDTKDAGGTKFDHALLLGDIPIVHYNDAAEPYGYREFTLDLDQKDSEGGVFLSLDALKIYNSTLDNLTGWDVGWPAPIWDMGATNWVALNGDNLLDNGSGKGDVLVYIPNRLFTLGDESYVYMYSQFGLQTDTSLPINPDGIWTSNDGFEEWGVREGEGTPVIPAPGAIALCGIGLVLVGWLRKSRTL